MQETNYVSHSTAEKPNAAVEDRLRDTCHRQCKRVKESILLLLLFIWEVMKKESESKSILLKEEGRKRGQ